MRLRVSETWMFSLSGHGWLYSVPKKYLHVSLLQAINYNVAMVYNKLTKYQTCQMKPTQRYFKLVIRQVLSL